MIKIVVTGQNGQLGSELREIAKNYPMMSFIFTDRTILDITKEASVQSFFDEHKNINYIINTAAYTAVDKAETDVENAFLVNTTAPELLAKYAVRDDIHLIHISTDYVYDTLKNSPHAESDETKPQNIYSISKLKGEEAVISMQPLSTIIRTSWVYSTFGNNFVKTIIRHGLQRPALNVVFDQIGTPTYAFDLAEAILAIIQKIENQEIERNAAIGIFNFSNEGVTSWYDFAVAIAEAKKLPCEIFPIFSVAYPTPAKRPSFTIMSKEKIKAHFGIKIKHWQKSLQECLSKMEL